MWLLQAAASRSRALPAQRPPPLSPRPVFPHTCGERGSARAASATRTVYETEHLASAGGTEADDEREGSWRTPASRARASARARSRARAGTAGDAACSARSAAPGSRGCPAARRLLAPCGQKRLPLPQRSRDSPRSRQPLRPQAAALPGRLRTETGPEGGKPPAGLSRRSAAYLRAAPSGARHRRGTAGCCRR